MGSVQRRAELRDWWEGVLSPYAAAVCHVRDVVLWDRPVVTLVAVLAVVVLARSAAAVAEGVCVASAACVALAVVVLGSYVARAYAGVLAGVSRQVSSLLPLPMSRFDSVLDDIAWAASTAEASWAAYVALLARGSLNQESVSRIAAIVTCIVAAYLLSFVRTSGLLSPWSCPSQQSSTMT
jgi:hypothetical protein